ncbi:hypothetical protein Tco_0901401 [Tanacetum coccineum]
MAASAIAISFDSSDESWRHASWVILFGDILTVIPSTSVVAPETSTIAPVISSAALVVETTLVASPTGLCGLVPYSGSDSDSPDEMSSPEHISLLPLCSTILIALFFKLLILLLDHHRRTLMLLPFLVGGACWPLQARRLASWQSSPRSSDHRYLLLVHLRFVDSISSLVCCSIIYFVSTDSIESSSGDSPERPLHSSSHSAGPSRKRCRFPVDSIPSSTPVMGSLALTRADLLPPYMRFRDLYSSKASIEEDTEIDPIETEVDIELVIGDGDDVRDHVEIDPRDVRDDTEEYEADTSAGDTVEVDIDPMSAPIVKEEIIEPAGEDSFNSSGTKDGIVRSFEDIPIDLNDAVRDFYHHMSKVRIDRIVRIKTVQRQLEADQLIARGQRVSMIERIDSLRLENLKVHAMLDIKRDRVNSLRLHTSLSQEEFRQVPRDRDDTRGRLRRLESYLERRFGFRP